MSTLPRGAAAMPLLASGATFLAMLDATVTNLAIVDMRRDFTSASIAGLSWIITLYAVLFAALLAPAGRLADVVGRRLLFRGGVAVFTVASLLCATATSLPVLLVARGLQGAGAAAMIPASLAVLLHDTPAERRARAIGLWSASSAMAAAVGPSVGGILVDLLHWRSLFIINLPIGVAIIAGARAIPRSDRTNGSMPDLLGTLLLGGGIGAFALGVAQGPSWHWSNARTVGLLVAGPIAAALSVWRSTRHPAPAIETSLWRSRRFAVANTASALYGAALYPWLLGGVLYLTQIWRYSELTAGLALTPGALSATAGALSFGRIGGGIGQRTAVVGGAVAMAASGLWILLAMPAEPRFLTLWLPAGVLGGAGMGAVAYGTASAAALSVSPLRFAGATGLNTTARQLGGAIGIAVLAAILPASAVLHDVAHVYLYCTLTSVAVAAAGFGLSLTPRAAETGQATTEAIDSRRRP